VQAGLATFADADRADTCVLFSAHSRDAYATEAIARGETYTFTDAWGLPRTWIKGEYAYLAPNAAGLLLARCNLKHHLVEEAALDTARLSRCRALLIPNAGHLVAETIARIVDVYRQQRLEEEPFIDTVRRIGVKPFKERVYAQTAAAA